MPRLFTGIKIPDDIREALQRLRQPVPGVSWIEPANYHLSLRFIGDVGNGIAREFSDELDRIDIDLFELKLEGLGVFGGNDPRSLWAGVAASPLLQDLARAHEKAARAAGLPPEGRAFKPHVTLARLRHPRPDALARLLERSALFRSRPFVVDHFALFSSRPMTGGGPYVVEATYPLRGAAPAAYLSAYDRD